MEKNEKYKTVLLKEEVLSIIERDLKTKNFELVNYVINPASANPMGFLGNHLKIKANVKVQDRIKELIYFVKKVPTDVPQHLDHALKTRAFYKEIELYKTAFEDLKNAQNPGNITKWRPDYFYSRDSELIVIEDASVTGYYMLPERTLMDEDHVKAALKAMAAMHAATFVFEKKFNEGKIGHSSPFFSSKEGEIDIGDIYEHLKFEVEVNEKDGHPGFLLCTAGIRSELALVDLLPGYTEVEKEKIKKELPDRLRNIFRLVKPSDKYKNIFIHGDLWANNLMFRKGKSGKVEDALLLDFQLVRYAPPGQDIMFLLHHCQNKSFRTQKQEQLIKYYYSLFSEEIEKNGMDANTVLPFETLVESCTYYEEFGLLMSALNFQLILIPSDITNKFLTSTELYEKNMLIDRSEMIVECYLADETYRVRNAEALNEIIAKYILVEN